MKNPALRFIQISLISAAVYFGGIRGDLCGQDKNPDKDLPNVIIMTFSGLRNSESIEDPSHQYIPHLWNEIFKEGTLYTNLVALNFQFHMPVVHAINTGLTYPVFTNSLRAPSIFQYVRKRYDLPQTKLWSLGTWYKSDYALATENYSQETYPCMFSSMDFDMSPQLKEILNKQELSFEDSFPKLLKKNREYWPSWDALGDVQFGIFKKILRKFKPKLVHYILNDVECAHSDTFGRYVLTIRKCDEKISEIKEFIDQDPYYKNNTYLIVDVDHERDLYYVDHFENSYLNPARVWMYIYGPGVKKGAKINRPVYHTDIFATVAYLMGVETHANDGKILRDCFK